MSRAPAFYGSLIIFMIAETMTFWNVAPPSVSIILPGIVSVFAASRLAWALIGRTKTTTEETAEADLRRSTVIIGALLLAVLTIHVGAVAHSNMDLALVSLMSLLAWCLVASYCIYFIDGAGLGTTATPLLALGFTWHMLDPQIAAIVTLVIAGSTAASAFAMRRHYADFISLIRAQTDAQKLGDDNFRLASTDALTGLAGRRQFFADLQQISDSSFGPGMRFAVAIADLDGFKPINDRHGHLVGDRVLQTVAARIRQGPGEFCRVYRLGGDEFALIAPTAANDDTLIARANFLINAIGQPIALGDVTVATGCSIGIAVSAATALTPQTLYERADYALFHAKRAGRNRALLFTSEHESLIRSRSIIEQELRNADLEREFFMLYQPILRAATGEVVGFECLERWSSPSLGEVSPASFVPVAEQSGLLLRLTPILLRKALADAASWPDHLRISFNLSSLDIGSHEQILAIIDIVERSGIGPHRIDFELTETAVLSNFDQARENMGVLRSTGARMSLDDFGTGYSSLSHVHGLPLDKIKVDRSFVRDIEQDRAARTIIRSMINLCRDLDLACVVEGVETAEQARVLRELKCDQLQGYYFAKPMTASTIGTFLDRRSLAAVTGLGPRPARRASA